MRRKIKELLNKEEGFTLVELLAVIVILGIIVAIAIPSIGGLIQNTQSNANDAEKALVEDAARLYVTAEDPNFSGEELVIDVKADLLDEGYLEERGETDDLGGTVTVTRNENGTFEFNTDGVTN